MPSRRALLGAALTLPSLVARAQSTVAPAQAETSHRLSIPLGNPVFTSSGRLFVSHHPMFETPERVSEILPGDQLRPFPDLRWNSAEGPSETRLDAVLGIRAMGDQVWMLDMGSRSQVPPKLMVWDTASNRPERTLLINPAALRRTSEPNDFVLDPTRNVAVIADEGVGNEGDGSEAALIVVTFGGVARRVLQGHTSTVAEPVPVVVDGREMVKTAKGKAAPMRVGCDGIALDHRSEWLYYGPLNGGAVWRVRMTDLLDGSLSTNALAATVERYASRPNAGGMTIDSADNLYLTEVGGHSIGVIPAADRTYRRLATHPDMLWPDGLTFGPDGMLYVTVAQLPLSAPLNGGTPAHRAPYVMMRTRPLAPGRTG